VVVKVRNSEAKARIRLPGTSGIYRVKASCGTDGTASSAPFVVVGRTSPLAATCEVLESGFSVDSKHWYVSFGAVVRNSSPELSATDVEVAFTFKDAAGNVILNYGLRPGDVPPGSTIVAGRTSIVANGATSLTVTPRCTTATEKVIPVAPGDGSVYVHPNISFEISISGQFANPASFPVSSQAPIGFILRDPFGHIIAGGSGYLDGFIPPGGTGTWHWEEFSWDPAYGTPASVQSTLRLEAA